MTVRLVLMSHLYKNGYINLLFWGILFFNPMFSRGCTSASLPNHNLKK